MSRQRRAGNFDTFAGAVSAHREGSTAAYLLTPTRYRPTCRRRADQSANWESVRQQRFAACSGGPAECRHPGRTGIGDNTHTAPNVTPRLLQLLDILLSDVDTDIGVAARDLGIADASFVRLKRARDRLACAQRLLEEAMPAVSSRKSSSTAARLQADGDTESEMGGTTTAMREAVELLAREWPEDYPSGAVEWLVAAEPERSLAKRTDC
jgi:hypothetical protein